MNGTRLLQQRDAGVVGALLFAFAGYHVTRSRQMAQQYGFLRSR